MSRGQREYYGKGHIHPNEKKQSKLDGDPIPDVVWVCYTCGNNKEGQTKHTTCDLCNGEMRCYSL